MKNVPNRMIVFAASALAFGTAAFGQTPMTAHIPFAFRTVTGTIPAGTYQLAEAKLSGGAQHMILLRNTATGQSNYAGIPIYDPWVKAKDNPSIVFACVADSCSLKAINTDSGTLAYQIPQPSARGDKGPQVSVVSVPMTRSNGE